MAPCRLTYRPNISEELVMLHSWIRVKIEVANSSETLTCIYIHIPFYKPLYPRGRKYFTINISKRKCKTVDVYTKERHRHTESGNRMLFVGIGRIA
jgi:2-succinyl-5-enolpyruvyl-6-hydroxy-3-cyclohexene-1-carboxylate synthase